MTNLRNGLDDIFGVLDNIPHILPACTSAWHHHSR